MPGRRKPGGEEEMEGSRVGERVGSRRQRVAAVWRAVKYQREPGLETGDGAWEVPWEFHSNVIFYMLTVLCSSLADDVVVNT